MKALAFKIPSHETENLYIKSLEKSLANYRDMLRQTGKGRIELPNLDFDTGRRSRAGEYALGDKTYMKLLDKLSKPGLQNVQPDLRENILAYFSEPPKVNVHSRKERAAWKKAVAELNALKQGASASRASLDASGEHPLKK